MSDLPTRLAQQFPELVALVDEHVEFYEEMLAYVWLSELRAHMVDRAAEDELRGRRRAREILDAMEIEFIDGDAELKTLISLGFLENLPGHRQDGAWLWDALPRELSAEAQILLGAPSRLTWLTWRASRMFRARP